MNLDLLAVIPARLGSSRVPEKVFQELSPGESLLERKIKQLRKILPRDRVVVNTESKVIAESAEACGATVMYRDHYYAEGHKATFSELITHVVSKLKCEHVCWAPFVVPFFEAEDFEESFAAYEEQVVIGAFDSLVSVVPAKEYFWDEAGPLNYQADHRHTISQDLPNWYRVTNGNYMASAENIMRNKYLLGRKVFIDVKSAKCGIDIDTVDDLEIARAYNRSLSRTS